MRVDLEQLRRHYEELSDDGLLEMDPDDLVPPARACYDAEMKRRGLGDGTPYIPTGGGSRTAVEPFVAEADPEWLEEAAEVYSVVDLPGTDASVSAEVARRALAAAGIPCHLEFSALPAEPANQPGPRNVWRLVVPGHLNLQATSTLDRDLFNQDFEADWKTHLESFSNEELIAMHPRVVFCGLFDRVERATRAYAEELERRGLEADES